jgi:hypothetical protein
MIVAAVAVPLISFIGKSDQAMGAFFRSLGTWEGFNQNANEFFVALAMFYVSVFLHFFGRIALRNMED